MSQFNVPAVEISGLKVSYPKHRGVAGVLSLSPLIGGLMRRIPFIRGMTEAHTILDGLDLTIEAGSITCIIGPNGAGKSALFRALSKVEPGEGGVIRLFGEDFSTKDAKDIAHVVSRANRELSAELSILEVIQTVAMFYCLDPEAAVHAGKELLRALRVNPDDDDKMFHELSVGTRGKAAIPRALLPLLAENVSGAGRILILDEPTLGFDPASVDLFLKALVELKKQMPGLTIILATNDPREMFICDDHHIIRDGKTEKMPEVFARLKAAAPAYEAIAQAASQLVGGNTGESSAEGHSLASIPRIPSVKTRPEKAVVWRHLRDFSRNWLSGVMVGLSLVVPNIVAALAAGRDSWETFVLGAFGFLVTLMVRDAYRFIDRERGYFNMLETLLTSPLTRWSHYVVTAKLAILTQLLYAATFSAVFWLLLGAPGAPIKVQGGNIPEITLAVLSTLAGAIIIAFAIGTAVSLVPFAMRNQTTAYFAVGMVPMMTVMFSGIFFPLERLSGPLYSVAQLNPLSYGTAALAEALGLDRSNHLWLSDQLLLVPGISPLWANIIVLLTYGSLMWLAALWFYSYVETLLRRAGRLRNSNG